MLWICYKIVCGKSESGEDILLDKKIGYSAENLVVAETEAYNGKYTTEEDSESFDKEPLGIEFGGTGAKTAKDACKNIGAVQAPISTDSKGFIYQNSDGTTSLVVPQKLFKYSIIVDNGADMNPSAVEYADDCIGFTPMKMDEGVLSEGSWTNNPLLAMFRPCVIDRDDDVPKYYLDKTNMSLKEDGTAATLTGEDGDVMVEVNGLLYGKFEHISESKFKFSILNYNEQGCFCFNDFGEEIKPRFYRGRYKCYIDESSAEMRSIAGVTPTVNTTSSNYRIAAEHRGTGYHQNNVYMLFLWQAMFLLLFKSRDSQSALGVGRTGMNQRTKLDCGWSDNYGWIWGTMANCIDGVVFLGVEDFYGDFWEFVDGVILNNDYFKLTRNPSLYNDTGDEFEISEPAPFPPDFITFGYMSSVKGTNDVGFLPANINNGGSNIYFCDMIYRSTNDPIYVTTFGGSVFNNEAFAGAFCWSFSYLPDDVDDYVGSRLCRK